MSKLEEQRMVRVSDSRLPPHLAARCPVCKTGPLDGATGVSKEGKRIQPEDGALTLCVYCGTLLAFVFVAEGKIGLRRATGSEEANVLADPLFAEIVASFRAKSNQAKDT